MIDPGTIMVLCFLVGLFPIMMIVRHDPRPSITKGSTVPVLREADDAEIERLEFWNDAFKEAYDPTNDDTYAEAIAYADAKQPPPKSSVTLPGGKIKFYDPEPYYNCDPCRICGSPTDGDLCNTCGNEMMIQAKMRAENDYKRKTDLSHWDANLQRFVEKGEEMDAIKATDGMMHFRHDGCGAQMSKQAWIAEGRPSAKQVIAFFRGESNSPSRMVK